MFHQVFDPSLIPALVATLKIALQTGVEALIALTVRNENTLANFLSMASMYWHSFPYERQLMSVEPEKWLKVEEIHVQFSHDVFLGMSEGQSDSDMEVKIFRMSMKML